MRSLARETVFKYIYSQLFNPGDEEFFTLLVKDAKLSAEDQAFATALKDSVINSQTEYLDIISSLAKGYKAERIYKTDKCAILIGIAELNNFKDIPVIVSIDEAVKLAGKYSTEKSTDFVNGILAEYVKRQEK